MTFGLPWALWGLVSIPILVWLDRRRRRPRLRSWPSLLLWRAVQEGAEPVRRRAFDRLLLLECAAALLLALAAAGPEWVTSAARRKVIVLFDRAPYMEAEHNADDSVWKASFAEWERVRAALAPEDEIIEYTSYRDLRFHVGTLPAADLRVVVTNRAEIAGPGLLVLGRAARGPNTGIDALHLQGDEFWFSLATDGEVRPVPVEVNGSRMEVTPGRGVTVSVGDKGASIKIVEDDCLAADNTATVERVVLRARDDTGSKYVRAALFEAGLPAVESKEKPDLVITRVGGEPLAEFVRGADCVALPGLFENLVFEDCVWRDVNSRVVVRSPIVFKQETSLLTWQGKSIAVLETWTSSVGRFTITLWLGMPVESDWDDHGTLALVIEKAKRMLTEWRTFTSPAGDGRASWTRFVSTTGVDRSWDGTLPPPSTHGLAATGLRLPLGLLAALVLTLYGLLIAKGGVGAGVGEMRGAGEG